MSQIIAFWSAPLVAQADLIVSGDRHLRQLKKFQGIPIIRLMDFLRLFPAEAPERG
jgi:hypothetical protein